MHSRFCRGWGGRISPEYLEKSVLARRRHAKNAAAPPVPAPVSFPAPPDGGRKRVKHPGGVDPVRQSVTSAMSAMLTAAGIKKVAEVTPIKATRAKRKQAG